MMHPLSIQRKAGRQNGFPIAGKTGMLSFCMRLFARLLVRSFG
jgi:hypothetical protein